jgi:Lar family restriction alleviation protein
MMTYPTLKPCPFCGGPAVSDRDNDLWRVGCINKCGVNPVVYADTEAEAVQDWNRRILGKPQ